MNREENVRLPPEQPSLAYADTSRTSGILSDAVVLLTRLTEGGTPGFVAVRRPISLSANGLMNILEAVAADTHVSPPEYTPDDALEADPDRDSCHNAWETAREDSGRRAHRLERRLRGEPQLTALSQAPKLASNETSTDTAALQSPSHSHSESFTTSSTLLSTARPKWSIVGLLSRLSFSKDTPRFPSSLLPAAGQSLKFQHVFGEEHFEVLQSLENMVKSCDISGGKDMQGYDLNSPWSRSILRSRRRRNLGQQLDQTRRFMRRFHPRATQDDPAIEVLSCRRRDAIVDWAEKSDHIGMPRSETLFKMRVFHKDCSPSFDHFQLKRLMVSDGFRGIFYLEQFPNETPEQTQLNSFYTPSVSLCRGERSAVVHFDTSHSRKQRTLGPWMFPSMRQLLHNETQGHLWSMASVSLDSPCIYSLAASRHFLVAADSSSSLIIARMNPDHTIAWALCQRSSQQPLQITNCVQIIEDLPKATDYQNENAGALLRSQAKERGALRLQRAGDALEAIIPRVQRRCEMSYGFTHWRQCHILGSRGHLEEPAIPSEPLRRLQIPGRRLQAVRRRQTMDDVGFFSIEPSFVQAADIRLAEMTIADSRRFSTNAVIARVACVEENAERAHDELPDFSPWLNKSSNAAGRCQYIPSDEMGVLLPSLSLTVLTASNDKQVSEFSLRYAPLPPHVTVDVATKCVPVKEGFATALPINACAEDPNYKHVVPVLELVTKWDLPYCCNHIAIHPQKDLLLFVGDDPNSMIFSRKVGAVPQNSRSSQDSYLQRQGTANAGPTLSRPLFIIEGHHDCGFAADWHPNGYMFATGNDDETLMVWDLRYLKGPQKVYGSETTAPRSVHFSPNGSFLVSCESEDSVVIYDVRGGFESRQVVPFFGACTGAVFSSDSETLYLGVAAPQGHGGIIELHLDNDLT